MESSRPRRALRWMKRIGLALVLLHVAVTLFAGHLLTRRPRPPYPEPLPDVEWAEAREVQLFAADGVKLRGWCFDVPGDRPRVVLLHMNRASRSAMLPAARVWAQLGYSSLAISLRSHGDSPGGRLDFGWTARHDALGAVRFARGEGSAPVIVHGVSLGSAAATFAAPEMSRDVAGYVFEAPFTNLDDATRNRTAMYLPPVLSDLAAWTLTIAAPVFVPHFDDIAPLDAAHDIPSGAPILVLYGTRDEHTTPDQVARFEPVLGERATFVAANVGHTGWLGEPHQLRAALSDWLAAW